MHQLVEAMANMKEDEALRIVDELLAKGEDPAKILDLIERGHAGGGHPLPGRRRTSYLSSS